MADQHNANIPAMGNTIAADIPDIKENLEYHKDVFEAFVNSWSNTTATNIKPKIMGDADNDTLIQCEETSDEDIIRFDIGGTEQLTIQDGVIEPTTDNDIVLGSASKQFATAYFESAIAINSITQGLDTVIPLNRKVIEIGDWNMDSTESVNVAHGLTVSKIRGASILIRADTGTGDTHVDIFAGGTYYIDTTNFVLTRTGSGIFDAVSYSGTSYNRGYITVSYTN